MKHAPGTKSNSTATNLHLPNGLDFATEALQNLISKWVVPRLIAEYLKELMAQRIATPPNTSSAPAQETRKEAA
jgi:hypothetical protein